MYFVEVVLVKDYVEVEFDFFGDFGDFCFCVVKVGFVFFEGYVVW